MRKVVLVFSALCLAVGLQATTKVTVPSAGALGDFLPTETLDTVTNLTLEGQINSADFEAMFYSMPKLSVIDLSATTLVDADGQETNKIPDYAFCHPVKDTGKPSLIKVILPLGTLSIGEKAFAHCSRINLVVFNETLETIEASAFSFCHSLQSALGASALTAINDSAFNRCYNLKTISTLTSVQEIGVAAFSDCYSLQNVAFSDNLQNIGESAFVKCYGLTAIEIPSSIIEIKRNTFYSCYGLQSVSLPWSLNYINDNAFHDCFTLKDIPFPSDLRSIGDSAFQNCNPIQQLVIPSSVTYIGANAFKGIPALQSVYLPSSVEIIEKAAFAKCSGLKRVTLEDGITTINDSAFAGCSWLPYIALPASITSLGENIFVDCTNMKELFVASSVPVDLNNTKATFSTLPKYCNLFVPKGAADSYKKAAQWSDFEISEIEYTVDATEFTIQDEILSSAVATIESNTIMTAFTESYWLSIDTAAFTDTNAVASLKGIGHFNFTAISSNPHTYTRTAIVYVKAFGSDEEIAIKITQEGSPAMLKIAQKEVELESVIENSATVDVQTTVTCVASCSEPWLRVSLSNYNFANASPTVLFASSVPLYFVAEANYLTQERTSKVVITADGLNNDTLTVTQAAGELGFTVSIHGISLASANDASDKVEVNSNIKWTATSSVEWLNVGLSQTRFDAASSTVSYSPNESYFAELWITATTNTSSGNRMGTVVISGNGVPNQTIVVSQSGVRPFVKLLNKPEDIAAEANSTSVVRIASNAAWAALSKAEWLHVSLSNTSFDNATSSIVLESNQQTESIPLWFIADENPSFADRTTQVRIGSEALKATIITITQKGVQKYCTPQSSELAIAAAENSVTSTSVESNVKWGVISNDEWLRVSLSNASFNNASSTLEADNDQQLWFVAASNTNSSLRVGTVTLLADGQEEQTIAVVQATGQPDIYIFANEETLAAHVNATEGVGIASNADWTATSDQAWLRVATSEEEFASASSTVSYSVRETSTASLWLVADENKASVERHATVTVRVDGLEPQTITVNQEAAQAFLSVSTSTVSFANATTTIAPLSVDANVAWTASSDQEWLNVCLSGAVFNSATSMVDFGSASSTVSFGSASATTAQLWFVAQTNTASTSRTATVTFSANGLPNTIVQVWQSMNTDDPFNTFFDVSDIDKAIEATTGLSATMVVANQDWTASSDQEWLQVSLSGPFYTSASSTVSFSSLSATTTALWFVSASNTSYFDRSARVTVRAANGESKVVTITQAAVPVVETGNILIVADSEIAIDPYAMYSQTMVLANQDWTASSNQEWLQVSLSGADFAAASSSVSFAAATKTVAPLWFVSASNTSTTPRSAQVKVSLASGKYETITLTQAGKPVVVETPNITLSENKITASATGGESSVIVASNVIWSAKANANWLSTSILSDKLTITIAANTITSERSALVDILVDGVIIKTITVTQAAKLVIVVTPIISVSENNLKPAAKGGSNTVTVTANVAWTVKAMDNYDWLSYTITDKGIVFVTKENTSTVERVAMFNVKAVGATTKTITITQAAATVIVVTPEITLSVSNLAPLAIGGMSTVTVTTTAVWTTKVRGTGVSVSSFKNELTIVSEQNEANTPRVAYVDILVNGVVVKTITITQDAAPVVTDLGDVVDIISVYPNPCTAYFTVNSSSNATVAVYTQAGALLLNTTASKTDQISLDGFAAGTYLVKVTSANGVTEHKLIKQ